MKQPRSRPQRAGHYRLRGGNYLVLRQSGLRRKQRVNPSWEDLYSSSLPEIQVADSGAGWALKAAALLSLGGVLLISSYRAMFGFGNFWGIFVFAGGILAALSILAPSATLMLGFLISRDTEGKLKSVPRWKLNLVAGAVSFVMIAVICSLVYAQISNG